MVTIQTLLYQAVPTLLVGFLTWHLVRYIQKLIHWNKICKATISMGKRNPIMGHMLLVTDVASFLNLIHKVVEETKARIINGWFFFFWPNFFLCHPETVKVLLKSSEPKPKQYGGSYRHLLPWLGDGLLLSDGSKWERNRRLLTPAFHFNVLKPYVQIYNDVVDVLLAKLANEKKAGEIVEIYQPIGLATLDVMLRCAFSHKSNVQHESNHPYAAAVKDLTHISMLRNLYVTYQFDTYFFWTKDGRLFTRLAKYVHNFADKIIQERKKSLKDEPEQLNKKLLDFLDILLTAKDENGNGLSDAEIRAEVDTFLFEGHDTTASAISWAVYSLGKYPDEQEKVFKEVIDITGDRPQISWDDLAQFRYLSMFLREVMRMFSPVPMISRRLTKPMQFENVEIPANMVVDINIAALHHHPEVYPDHECFRPDRFNEENAHERNPYAFLPFSAGSRNCIGQNFAMHEMKVFLARLVKRYKVTLDPNHEVEFVPESVMRAKTGIKIMLEER